MYQWKNVIIFSDENTKFDRNGFAYVASRAYKCPPQNMGGSHSRAQKLNDLVQDEGKCMYTNPKMGPVGVCQTMYIPKEGQKT